MRGAGRALFGGGAGISEMFRQLGSGDPVAWGIVAGVVAIAAFFALLVWKVGRDHRREDEARARKHARRP